jgi:hypothetical protein
MIISLVMPAAPQRFGDAPARLDPRRTRVSGQAHPEHRDDAAQDEDENERHR